MRRKTLTVEKLGADSIDICALHRARLVAGEAQRLQFGLRWPRLSSMIGYRFRLELRFGPDTFPQSVRVSWTPCHLGGKRPWFHCPGCRRRIGKLYWGGERLRYGADNVSAIRPTGARPKALQGGDCMRLGKRACSSPLTLSMIPCPNARAECTTGHIIACGRALRPWKPCCRVVSASKRRIMKT